MTSFWFLKPGITSSSVNLFIRLPIARFLLICAVSFSSVPVFAHGYGHEKILQITAQLKAQGDSADLYAKRAHIFQDNQHWLEAMSDFDKAADLDPDNADYDIDRASLCYDAGEYMRSLDFVDLYLLRHENTMAALLLKARSYRALKQFKQAGKFYELALSQATTVAGSQSPQWYVEFADTLTKAGDKQKALHVLQQGIEQLGDISVFQVMAAELEVDLALYDSALERIDQLLNHSQRKDIWLARRADILSSAGRGKEAQRTYQQAYTALRGLPQRLQNLPVSRDLENTLLARISAR